MVLIALLLAAISISTDANSWAAADVSSSTAASGLSLSVQPDASMILLNGSDTAGVKHVVRSAPSYGASFGLSIRRIYGNWTPKFAFSSREVRFYGSNNEQIEYDSAVHNSYSAGIERILMNGWTASGMAGYSSQLFMRTPSVGVLAIDNVSTPFVVLGSEVGLYRYRSILLSGRVKAIAYLPVSTSDYSGHAGYGVQPSVGTTHEFSKHVSGSAEISYLKRIQNSSVFDMTEQDLVVSFAAQLSL